MPRPIFNNNSENQNSINIKGNVLASERKINAIRQKGLKIPEDISVAGYDGIELARRISPLMTTIVQDTDKIGRVAASKLIDLINNPKGTLIEQIVVEGTLEKGESVANINPV